MPDLEACSKSGLDWGAQTWGRAGPILAGKKFRAWNLPQSSWITNPGGLKPPIVSWRLVTCQVSCANHRPSYKRKGFVPNSCDQVDILQLIKWVKK